MALSVVVLPLPGLDMRLRRKVCSFFSSARTLSASRLLSANTLCFISMTLSSDILFSHICYFQLFYHEFFAVQH